MRREDTSFGRWLVAAVLVGLGIWGAGTAWAATPFVHEHVDGNGSVSVGYYNSLALDAQGNPHICYVGSGYGDLRYAVKEGDSWTVEIVIGGPEVDYYTSLALDAQGNPHISYYDYSTGNLMYATKTGGTWVTEVVDNAANVGEYSSIALTPQGIPCIAYSDQTDGDLKYANQAGAGNWNVSTVDATGNVGEYPSLAFDAYGNPHISYFDGTNADLKYASLGASAWSIETVDSGGSVGWFTSLVLNAEDSPCISYSDLSSGNLKYAFKSNGIWVTEAADPGGVNYYYSSLALDAQGNPSISYFDYLNQDLKYAVKNNGVWTTETVESDGNVGVTPSLALDAQGNPHVSYYDGNTLGLSYADASVHLTSPVGGELWAAGSQQTVSWSGVGPVQIQISGDGGLTYTTLVSPVSSHSVSVTVPDFTTDRARVRVHRSSPPSDAESPGTFSIAPNLTNPWWRTIADATANAGPYTSLALDAGGVPHISYYNYNTGDLRYASKSGSSWTIETVDATGDVGQYTSLALNGQGEPVIGYYDVTNGDLKVAAKTGGAWTTETVDATGKVGQYVSLALDAGGNPHLSYFDVTNYALKYAVKSGGVWTTETVDASTPLGGYTSLALDAHGDPHVSYYDASNNQLRYAHKSNAPGAGTAWTIEMVNGAGEGGEYTSIALDDGGNPRISYFDNTDGTLRYASKDAELWTIELVDAVPIGSVGLYNSLALDGQGRPRISYYDAASYRLKFAARNGHKWTTEVLDASVNIVGYYSSLALDDQGNAHVSYYGYALRYASAAVEIADPSPAAVWPVGASRTVTWKGTGQVDLSLSTDGGKSWEPLQEDLTGGSYNLLVPHAPSRFARLKLTRAVPHSVAVTDLFTIQTDIALLSLSVSPAPAGLQGADIAWQTDPGPADLSGYRLEERTGSGDWTPVASLTRETSYHDPAAVPGEEYRLFGVNGYGEALLLGQARFGIPHPLAAGPLPYRGGDLQITFATAGGLGGGTAPARVALFDLQGRRIKSLAEGDYLAGVQTVTWDGRDDAGQRVGAGIYFLRAAGSGQTHNMKVVVVR